MKRKIPCPPPPDSPTRPGRGRSRPPFRDPRRSRTNRYNPAGPVADEAGSAAILARWIAHWDAHGFGQWAVAARDAPDRVIGFGGVAYKDHAGIRHLNLGFRFAHDAWGQGYATELGRTAIAHAFDRLRMDAVHAIVRPANAASISVLEKLGMERCGMLDDVPGKARSLVYRLKLLAA